VQQCLVREPLLAVAMSFAHKLDPAAFRTSIANALPTTMAQHTTGSVSGEINEHICFAALQLASLQNVHASEKATASQVKPFLKSLFSYMEVKSLEASLGPSQIKSAFPDFYKKGDTETDNSQTVSDLLDEVKADIWKEADTVPLLVPAWSKESLEAAVKDAPNLFGGIPIAGLVPGVTNARLDADAYDWKPRDANATFAPCWNFEFKVFSNGYTIKKAKTDLRSKCKNEGKCHALLIGTRPYGSSELSVEREEGWLRITALIQSTP
jgi:hypothetical protein